ncbi:hypothetical protein Ddc_16227 [Ditylenchus destructor]|nr:hypothetical protein Ddc_16227 [Ditylenchus destructor]
MARRSQSPFVPKGLEIHSFGFMNSLKNCAHTYKEVYDELNRGNQTKAGAELLQAFNNTSLAASHICEPFGLQVGPLPPNPLDVYVPQLGFSVPCKYLVLLRNTSFDQPQAIKIKTPPGSFLMADQSCAILERSALLPEMFFVGVKALTKEDVEAPDFLQKCRLLVHRRNMTDDKILRRYQAQKTRAGKAQIASSFWISKDTRDDEVVRCFIPVTIHTPTLDIAEQSTSKQK